MPGSFERLSGQAPGSAHLLEFLASLKFIDLRNCGVGGETGESVWQVVVVAAGISEVDAR